MMKERGAMGSGYGYRDDMIAQFKQDLYNKIFSFRYQGKGDEIDTLQNRFSFPPNFIVVTAGSIPDDIHNYDYNDDGLDGSVRGAERDPELR